MRLFVFTSIVALTLPVAYADPTILNLSTGFDPLGNLITADLGCDGHWVQTAGPTPACADSAAQVVHQMDADWGSTYWLLNSASSAWITSDASNPNNGTPLPTYMVQFYLADTAGASLSGSWTIDDFGTISLNGHVLDSLLSGDPWTTLHPVSASEGYFVTGVNTLAIALTHAIDPWEGVRFDGSVSGMGASYVTPEPASGLLLLTGLGGVLLGFRRRR